MKSTEEKLREIISQGLVSGLGEPQPGQLCVEAAICLAMGEPHSDRPSCVALADMTYAIRINDAPWSSPKARADALLPLAIAQLDTAGQDRKEWARRLTEGTIRRVLPLALRAAAKKVTNEHASRLLLDAAERCEQDANARDAADAASHAADEAARITRATSAYLAARAAVCAVNAADARTPEDAAEDAAHAAAGAAASAAASATRAARAAAEDEVLRASVQVAIDAYVFGLLCMVLGVGARGK